MGIEPVAAGEDTQWHLRFGLGWPDWVVLLFVTFAILFVVSVYLREGALASRPMKLFLAALRLALIGLVVLMLGGLELAIDRTGLPHAVYMVDDSESMKVCDHRMEGTGQQDQVPSRLQRVIDWLCDNDGQSLARLTSEHKLQVFAHSSAPRLLGTCIEPSQVGELLDEVRALKPSGTESRLGSNLRSVLNSLRGTPPSAVVLITDGVATQGEPLTQAAQYASRKNIPVFTIGVGSPDEVQDLELRDLLVDDTVFVDDIVTFDAKLVGRGLEARDVEVVLRQKGLEEVLDRQTVRLAGDGQPTKVRLAHDRPRTAGTMTYTIEVPTAEGEIVTTNNRLERQVEVIKQKVRVLYVETYPRYEFRYLKNLLEREPTVDLKVLLLEADPEYVEQDRVAISYFPTAGPELFDNYDVLIFGDVSPAFFSQAQLENVVEYVRGKGGGFLVIAGNRFVPQTYQETPLQALLPVEIESSSRRTPAGGQAFTPQLTVEGRASPIFRFAADPEENEQIWRTLPPQYWYAPLAKAKAAAQVFVEHPDTRQPLIAGQFFGAGRTFFQAFDATWRWRYRVEDLYHSRYWIQVVRYLSRSKLLGTSRTVELLVDRRVYRRGDPVLLRARFFDELKAPKDDKGVTVLLERQGHTGQTVELSRLPGRRTVFEGVCGRTQDGHYRARLTNPLVEGTSPSTEFQVVPPPGELDRVQMNEDELRRVADMTGGAYFPLAEADKLFDHLPPGRKIAINTDPPISLWNTWPVLLLFFAMLLCEWLLRKRCRML